MILLLPGNARALLGKIRVDRATYGWLLSRQRTMTKTGTFGLRYGVDNQCFTLADRFNADLFLAAIGRIVDCHGADDCLFAVAPDTVGDAEETLARFGEWSKRIRACGVPVALAGQDGLEKLSVPWDDLDALFIGGTTHWKLGRAAADLITEARERGKWTHMGRVNSVRRAVQLKAKPDSVDGTAWAKHPAHYAREWQNWRDWLSMQLPLLSACI